MLFIIARLIPAVVFLTCIASPCLINEAMYFVSELSESRLWSEPLTKHLNISVTFSYTLIASKCELAERSRLPGRKLSRPRIGLSQIRASLLCPYRNEKIRSILYSSSDNVLHALFMIEMAFSILALGLFDFSSRQFKPRASLMTRLYSRLSSKVARRMAGNTPSSDMSPVLIL